jgi:4-oxalocrotonate tautomerase
MRWKLLGLLVVTALILVCLPSSRYLLLGLLKGEVCYHGRLVSYWRHQLQDWRIDQPGGYRPGELIEGVFTPAQKQEMIRKLTDTMVSIEGEAMRPVTWVVVEEVKSGDWGIGGNPLTTSDVKALAAGKPKG